MSLNIQHWVVESELVRFVAEELEIPYSDADKMYSDLGAYEGHDVNFSTTYPDQDAFSKVVQAMMIEEGITSLAARYDD